jgi:signal peptidase II
MNMKQADNFNPGKWLIENKLTNQSQLNEMPKIANPVPDQLTKIIALNSLLPNTSQRVNAMMNWVLVFNPGAAFSFLADGLAWQKWFFIGIGLVATVTILWLLKRHSKESLFCFSLALILGGAVGNLIDRFAYGAVVDFIDVYYQQFHWPAFNVADSAISLGAALLIFDELRRVVKKR